MQTEPMNSLRDPQSKVRLSEEIDIPDEILEKWQKTVDLMAEIIGVPAGLIMKVHKEEIEVLVASRSKGNPYEKGEKANLNTGLYCETVMAQRGELLVPDARKDPEWDHNPDIELNMVSYLGVPLMWPNKEVFGTMCVLDNDENSYNQLYHDLLNQFRQTVEADMKLLVNMQELLQTHNDLVQQHQQLKETQTQLVQAEKMAGLGTLVAGVAHEINNPVNFVFMNSQNLQKDIQSHKAFLYELLEEEQEIVSRLELQFEKFETKINDIHEGSERIKTIVLDLRTFSRLDAVEQKTVKITAGINSTLRLVRAKFQKGVEFKMDFQNDPEMECWPAQLNQVFMNILINGAQAIRKKQQDTGDDSPGTLTIRTFISGKELAIQFQDSGCGMTEEVKQKMFEPFFTTKNVGEGTGMGMAISYGIIEKHQGRIEVDSSPGEGTTFNLFLPLSEK